MIVSGSCSTNLSVKIYFCDDSEDNLNVFKDYLKRYESPYINAVYTKEHSNLVELCKNQSPDMVITDIFLKSEARSPESFDGIDAIKTIKSETDHDIYFVIVSGNSELDYVIKALNTGVNKYYQKPISYESFYELLREKEEKSFFGITLKDAWSLNDERTAHEICHCISKMTVSYTSCDILGFSSSFNKWKEYGVPINPDYFFQYYKSAEINFNNQLETIQSKLTDLYCVTNDAGISRKILKFVNENLFNHSLGLNMVASHFCCSSSNISTIFRNTLNKNFSKYIQEHRIFKAKKLLLTTNKSINEIAYDCGYSYSNYFIKKFVEVEGMTPGNWRKAK